MTLAYTRSDLENWNEKIETLSRAAGLDYYPQEFELVDYNEMIGYEAYTGMPSRYPHWSFGKSYEKIKTLYRYNLSGLPYEMVINSDPCIAYLIRDNTLLLQILTMAHVYGHNDFFKNNRLFKEGTDAGRTFESFRSHAAMIRSYINDPGIGYAKVEEMLNAAHSVKLQIGRTAGEKRKSDAERRRERIEQYNRRSASRSLLEPQVPAQPPELEKIPLEPEDDLLAFIMEHGDLEDWQQTILGAVREEAAYFLPQIETKILNEGWASYWHYTTLNHLDLPPGLHLEFIKRHNDVVRPIPGGLNPYFLGFEMLRDIAARYGEDKIFEVRALERDASFIRKYLTRELCEKLHLFEYARQASDYFVEEIADETGWKKIRDTLADTTGMGTVPYIRVVEMSRRDKTLTLEHVYDGRELEAAYMEETLKYLYDLWRHPVVLYTKHHNINRIVRCEDRHIRY